MRLIVLAAVLSAVPLAAAQESPQPPAAQEASPPAAQDGFVPVKPGELQEQLPAAPLVFTAYSVIWMVLIAYVFLLWRRLATVERELRDVHAKLQARRP